MSSSNPYGTRMNGSAHGDVFTHLTVVNYMLDLVGYTACRDLSRVTILEPSCGEGEFLLEILRRLSLSAEIFHFDVNKAAHDNIFAYEIDDAKIDTAVNRIKSLNLNSLNVNKFIRQGDFLREDPPQVDIVVGNPPYVRYEQLPAETIKFCKSTFPTFHYRADLYIPFYEKTLKLLKPEGKHCFICSNRWLKNEYGRKLRQLIIKKFRLELIIDMERVNPFQEKVSAYTDIVVLSRAPMKLQFRFCKINNIEELDNICNEILLPAPKNEDWISSFNRLQEQKELYSIEELGLKIGIGVATGADNVFISDNLTEQIERELLMPIITGRDLRGNSLNWSGLFLFNPYNADGSLIDLQQYPKAMAYLLRHESRLRGRYIAKKRPDNWYRTIDRVHPELQHQPKILLPDMSANTFIFVDEGLFYPSHNLYYVTGADVRHLKLLSAVLISEFTFRQLSNITNKMNGDFIRWQSQYLHKLRVPNVFSFEEKEANSLLSAYDNFDIVGINEIISRILSKQTFIQSNRRKEIAQLPLSF